MEENQNIEHPQKVEEKSKMNIPQAIILAGLFIALAIFFKSPVSLKTNTTGGNNTIVSSTDWKIKPEATEPNDHRIGPKTAEIVIIEYSDTECPFCKNFHKTLHQVIDNYDGRVAWVYKHLPLQSLHKYAYDEAVATECAEELGGNVAFWNYLDLIFENTQSNDGLPPSMLDAFAKKLRLDSKRFTECMTNPAIRAQVDADIEEVKKLTDRLGTPYTLIQKNGATVDTLTGALPYAQVIEKIDAALNK